MEVIGIICFAFSTTLGWAYYGERFVEYFAGRRVLIPYRILYVPVALIAAVMALDLVWLLADESKRKGQERLWIRERFCYFI